MGTRGRGRPGFTSDPDFVLFLITEVENCLAAQGRADKRLSVDDACQYVTYTARDDPQDSVGRLTFVRPGTKGLSMSSPATVRNRYIDCLHWLAENRDSPVAAEIARWRAGRRLVADDLSKPPRFSVQLPKP